ncbi:hypothetical protein [Teredinibacter haidensis]|uniref:hypothetical protein n=1 Tax=Teredinibacter haidensis TaxID=2731755 RepID=UPI0009491221|nr:hypothetical protein [Teredinibacter haidensis]
MNENEKKALRAHISANSHEVYVISLEEMDNIVAGTNSPKKRIIAETWGKLKGGLEFSVNYGAAGKDIVTLSKLIADLGGISTQAYVKHYGGKAHIILKGAPGLRRILTGTKYGVQNAKVISMGLGKRAAVRSAKVGGVVTIFLLSAYRIAEFVLTDETTLSYTVGYLATDIVKVGIATGASIAAAAAAFSIAIGPLAAAIIVGVGVSYLLGKIDQKYGLSYKVVEALDEMGDDVNTYIKQKKDDAIRAGAKVAESFVDYAIDRAKTILIATAKHQINRFLSPFPR